MARTVMVHGRPKYPQSEASVERANADIKEMIISWMNDDDTTQWSEGLRFVQFQKNRSHHRVIDQPPYKAVFGVDPNNGLSSSSIPKELLPQLETEEDLEQILADAGDGDTTDDTTDDDESAISTDISEADTDSNILSAEALQSTSYLVTTEIAPNSEETSVVQTLNPNNSDNDVQLVEPVKDTATSEIATDITETHIQHARTRALSGQQIQAEKLMRTTKRKLSELSVGNNVIIPIPQYDRGPTDPRNKLGEIEEVSEYGYRVGTFVGTLSRYLCRNQIEAVNDTSLIISMIPSLQISLREAVCKISKNGGQGYLSCKCKGGCKTSKCK
jgi:hypothetical protein